MYTECCNFNRISSVESKFGVDLNFDLYGWYVIVALSAFFNNGRVHFEQKIDGFLMEKEQKLCIYLYVCASFLVLLVKFAFQVTLYKYSLTGCQSFLWALIAFAADERNERKQNRIKEKLIIVIVIVGGDASTFPPLVVVVSIDVHMLVVKFEFNDIR